MISIVIPVLNEAENIPRLLAELNQEVESHEIIVVDGGSSDDSKRLADDLGVTTISATGGRGGQICAGIESSKGDIILVLHADCSFGAGGLTKIRKSLQADFSVLGGNFRLLFDGQTSFSDWITKFYAYIRRFGFYYGDSGIFVRRSTYDEIGGIRNVSLMEDFDFVRRLEALGQTICIDDPPLVTSIRRFRGRRRAQIVLGWLYIHVLYYLGVSSRWMARVYDSERKNELDGEPIIRSSKGRRS